MKEAKKLLNEEAVKSVLNDLALQNRTLEAPGLLMYLLGQELHQITTSYYTRKAADAVSILPHFAHLRPSDEQIRCALIRLLALPATQGTRKFLFSNARHWLAVFKVLHFLNLFNDDYGCMAHMEVFIRRIFADAAPRIACNQDALTKKNMVKPFKLSLTEWEKQKESKDMRDYWSLALHFLQFLEEECGSENRTSSVTTEVSTELN